MNKLPYVLEKIIDNTLELVEATNSIDVSDNEVILLDLLKSCEDLGYDIREKYQRYNQIQKEKVSQVIEYEIINYEGI